jgi:hypothetical protein
MGRKHVLPEYLEYLIKVNIIAPDRDNLALRKVGAQAGNLTEAFEYGIKILNVIFERATNTATSSA